MLGYVLVLDRGGQGEKMDEADGHAWCYFASHVHVVRWCCRCKLCTDLRLNTWAPACFRCTNLNPGRAQSTVAPALYPSPNIPGVLSPG